MSVVFTAAELAERHKVSIQTIRSWWHQGILPEPMCPTAHSPRWRVEDIVTWEQNGGRAAQLKAYRRRS
jgi:predicted site-specific integrase-resolvase